MALAALMIPWVGGLFLHSVREFGPTAALYEAVIVSVIAWSMLIILVTSAAHLETRDVARRRAERALLMVKRIDPLTKTLNRFRMSEKLETAWAEFKGGGAMFGMLMLDVDYFAGLTILLVMALGMAFWKARRDIAAAITGS